LSVGPILGRAQSTIFVCVVTAISARRTCATWLRAAGTPPHLIAPLMGHADSRMVERVYGRLEPSALAQLIAEATGTTSAGSQQTGTDRLRFGGLGGRRAQRKSAELAPHSQLI
jgi:hypothetical protein